ncbi:MAG: hypothetical protein JW869_04775 [Candidatus Omnitrophica bacterium]|nr:hypothetical protein [Candidatus Omnitrophota bacterium]
MFDVRKILTLGIGVLCLLTVETSFADTMSAVPLRVQAQVTQSIELSYVIFEGAPVDGVLVDSMNFGILKDRFEGDTVSRGSLFSDRWYTVMVVVGARGGPHYEITQTASALTSGTAEIPANAYLCTPVYAAEDEWQWEGPAGELMRQPQGPQPPGSVLHPAGTAVEVNKKVYTSEPIGSSRIVQIIYSITNGYKDNGEAWPGFTGDPIPTNIPPGEYSGTITVTVTTL